VLWETTTEDVLTCMVYDEHMQNLVCGTEDHTVVTVDIPDIVALRGRQMELSGVEGEGTRSSLSPESGGGLPIDDSLLGVTHSMSQLSVGSSIAPEGNGM